MNLNPSTLETDLNAPNNHSSSPTVRLLFLLLLADPCIHSNSRPFLPLLTQPVNPDGEKHLVIILVDHQARHARHHVINIIRLSSLAIDSHRILRSRCPHKTSPIRVLGHLGINLFL